MREQFVKPGWLDNYKYKGTGVMRTLHLHNLVAGLRWKRVTAARTKHFRMCETGEIYDSDHEVTNPQMNTSCGVHDQNTLDEVI